MHSHFYLLAMAALQGVTELFPISSLGHSILVPALAHWPIDREADWFLPFVVVLHLGTALALLLYFHRDWTRLIGGWLRARGGTGNEQARTLWLLVVGTIPAGILGLLLAHRIRDLFGGFAFAAVALMLNGVLLIVGDRLKNRNASGSLASLGFGRALFIGAAQALALIPGFSRSGATLVAGLGAGLEYEAAARMSFLLATPIIAAAGVLEVPKLLHAQMPPGMLGVVLLAGVLSGVCAWLSTWFLMRWFRGHEIRALRPFGVYCLLFGALALLLGR
ncbi:undecaprenyl-diphosphate phosphatase [Thiomonas sp.]|jgi:undecaprenyl-diphosphatase|uniref:undecaprenyl-diphosphate phosphatase n=1 Tax=Thiomonas sp. TaxID=2047785 RepID=UPI002619EF0B|nr:undecaprenyl-diphosphate phosphatase [Thiomonas sp.]